jgi:hypothetical protein
MNAEIDDDDDVPALAVQALNEATQRARQIGDIVVVRDGYLIRLKQDSTFEVIQKVPESKKASVLEKKIKR